MNFDRDPGDGRDVQLIRGPIEAVVHVPGSKSIANRALICAALADGVSTISNMSAGDDTNAMVSCLAELGIETAQQDSTTVVTGTAGLFAPSGKVLHAALAGTTSRFITAVASLADRPLTIDGHTALQGRPFAALHDALAQIGVKVSSAGVNGTLPVTVHGPPTTSVAALRGDVSSQFISALMLIGPYVSNGLRIELTTALISRPYLEMTASVMANFGCDEVEITERTIVVPPGCYTATNLTIEPDASSASYPLAVAALVGGIVHIPGLGLDAVQGDTRFADLLADMGCAVVRTKDGVWVGRDLDIDLEGVEVDMADISDLVPTLAVVACFAASPTIISGVAFIRNKESDRLGDLVAELCSAGADAVETADGLVIRPSVATLRPCALRTHHDHRLAMAFGVLGSAAGGLRVLDPNVVTKSWPGFWEMLDVLRGGGDA